MEVIRWISIVLMWIAVAMNLYALTRCLRTEKKLNREYEYLEKIRTEYETARDKYIKLLDEQWKEVSDEGEN
jgi:hypothetical protein